MCVRLRHMKFLITGGCGFLGANLGAEVLRRGDELFVIDNLSRTGGNQNLAWLRGQGAFEFYDRDIRNLHELQFVLKKTQPDAIFHLAGQVAMTTSIADPRLDFETNVIGGHNLLTAVRDYCPEAPLLYSSTNKVYGDLDQFQFTENERRYTCDAFPMGFPETIALDFRSPYGCSKGAIDQYMLDYSRTYGLSTTVFRHSSIFGSRQFSSYDQGWIGWFVQQALLTRKGLLREAFTISGDGKQVRDVLFSEDLVALYFSAIEHRDAVKGQAFNIGGGMANSLSLLELFEFLEQELNVHLKFRKTPWRLSDQKVFVADLSKIASATGWKPRTAARDGLQRMIQWVDTQEGSRVD